MAATIEGLFSRLKFVAATLLLGASSAHAWSTIDVMSAISCNADLNREFYQQKLTQYYGKILRNEGSAYWYKGKDSLYGSTIREIFVSSGPPYLFVGVVLEAPPTEVAEAIRTARFAPANMFFDEKKQQMGGFRRPSDGLARAEVRQSFLHRDAGRPLDCPNIPLRVRASLGCVWPAPHPANRCPW